MIPPVLSDEQVRALRNDAANGVDDANLAATYGLTVASVRGLRLGHRRKGAGGPLTKTRPDGTPKSKLDALRARLKKAEARISRLEAALEAVGVQGVD